MLHANENMRKAFQSSAPVSVPTFFRKPGALECARQIYASDLQELREGLGEFAPYRDLYEQSLRALQQGLQDENGIDKLDRSGQPRWFHGKHVGDYWFCMARQLGFNAKQAVTVMLAGHHHDDLEAALKKGLGVYNQKLEQLQRFYDRHDRDVTNLVKTMTRIPASLRYLSHIGTIGDIETFTDESTELAPLAAFCGKFVDANNNHQRDRTAYLDDWREQELILRSTGQIAEADALAKKIQAQEIRQLQYPIVIDFMAAKIDGLIPRTADIPAFLATLYGRRYLTPKYTAALKDGLTSEEFESVSRLIPAVANQHHANDSGFGGLDELKNHAA